MSAEKFTIPGGFNFGHVGTEGTAFFAWLVHNHVDPSRINPAADVVITTNSHPEGVTWAITAVTTDGESGTWPLGTPTAPVVEWLRDQFGIKTAPLDSVKPLLDRLEKERKAAKAANDAAEELRAEILGILTAQRATIGTINGQPVIQKKAVSMPGKFNRKAFEAEYPEIAERFTGAAYDQTRLEFI